MKGAADFYESETHYDLDTTAEFAGDATSAAELEAELILGLAKNFGVGSLDLYGVAERLAGLLEDDDVSEDEDASADQHHDSQGGPSDEVLAGYSGCMHEALRYLMEEEGLPPSHPLVQGLANHLVTQQRLLEHQLASDRPTSE